MKYSFHHLSKKQVDGVLRDAQNFTHIPQVVNFLDCLVPPDYKGHNSRTNVALNILEYLPVELQKKYNPFPW